LKLSVVIPVYNGGPPLRRCLEALSASTRQPDEVIVVDDSSTDESAAVARTFGARAVSLPDGPRGPAAARNRGVELAEGEMLVFIDADAAVHPDTLRRIEGHLTQDREISALFGSYDTDPPVRTLVSRFKNLLHHYVHQHGNPDASTFWSGCGAVYRDVFVSLGGFDANLRYLEDIELGGRMRQAGYRIRLCPDVQVTHLKHWTFRSLIYEDIWGRAVPWTKLIVHQRHLPADLNVNVGSRLSAGAVWFALLCVVLGFWLPWLWAGVPLAVLPLVILNFDLYRFFARQGGLFFLAGAFGLHVLYLFYSSLTFALIAIWSALKRKA
jgi:glycosyltransferase involved in cell wall biosynthesis